MEKLASQFLGQGPAEICKGRFVAEGHVRGWRLQCRDLREVSLQDPRYQDARHIDGSRTVVSGANGRNTCLIPKYVLGSIPRGHRVESGSCRGGSALFMAHVGCDIDAAVRYSYDPVKPFMVPGGYFVVDDATVSNCTGATGAVEELPIGRDGLHSEQIKPRFLFRPPFTAEPAR